MQFRALFLGLLACGACQPTSTQPSAPKSEPVAVVGGKSITAEDLRAKILEQPPLVRDRYKSLERKKEFLENLIRFEVMLQEAKRRGLESDPEVRSAIEKILVQRLIRVRQEEAEKASAPSERELRKYYDEHLAEFVRPSRVRVSHVFFASTKGDAKRGKVQAEVYQAVADVRAKELGPNKTAFAQLASARSDDLAAKSAGGDLGFKTQAELEQVWGAPVAAAAFGLKTLGEIAGPIESDKGFHLLKLAGRQEGIEQSFDSVKARIETRLLLEKRAKSFDDFAGDLRAKANVKIDEKALDRVTVEETQPSPSPK